MQEPGQRLALERKRLGWSQDRLATELGVSRSVVAFMENGRTPIYLDRLMALDPLGFDIAHIIWGRRSQVMAGKLLDWALLKEIQQGIREWSDEHGRQLSLEKEHALLKLLYTHFIEQGSLNKESLAEAMSIAA